MSTTHIKYAGTALPDNAETVVLFSTVTAHTGKSYFQMAGVERFIVDIKNDQSGTLKSYKSSDRGTTWVQITSTAVAAAAATGTNTVDYLVSQYEDWKVSWVNGATIQGAFGIDLAMTTDRSPGG